MQIHVVSPGQTLYAIGRQYGIAPGFIARYNGLREPYRLAVGQALLILRPEQAVTVQTGDTLFSVAQAAGVSPLEILRMNPNLGGQARLFPGQVLVTRLEQSRTRPVEVNGYAYPYVNVPTLRGILPFASDLTPFTYGFTAQGTLVGMDDEPLIALARLYGVRPLMHLSTLTESGAFSAERAAQLFADPQAEQALIGNTVAQMLARGYGGVDVDFEFLGAALADSYASFVGRLRAAVNAAGGELIAALAPKVSATQPGVLYEGHDYAAIAANADAVLLMTYECMLFARKNAVLWFAVWNDLVLKAVRVCCFLKSVRNSLCGTFLTDYVQIYVIQVRASHTGNDPLVVLNDICQVVQLIGFFRKPEVDLDVIFLVKYDFLHQIV